MGYNCSGTPTAIGDPIELKERAFALHKVSTAPCFLRRNGQTCEVDRRIRCARCICSIDVGVVESVPPLGTATRLF